MKRVAVLDDRGVVLGIERIKDKAFEELQHLDHHVALSEGSGDLEPLKYFWDRRKRQFFRRPPRLVAVLDDKRILQSFEEVEADQFDKEEETETRVLLDQSECDLEPGKYKWDPERRTFVGIEKLNRQQGELDYAILELQGQLALIAIARRLTQVATVDEQKTLDAWDTGIRRTLDRARGLRRKL